MVSSDELTENLDDLREFASGESAVVVLVILAKEFIEESVDDVCMWLFTHIFEVCIVNDLIENTIKASKNITQTD